MFDAFSIRASDPEFYESRGLINGQCYQQNAIRRCKKFGKSCTLELFTGSRAVLLIPIKGHTILPKNNSSSTDFGNFKFIFLKNNEKKVSVEIVGKTSIHGSELIDSMELIDKNKLLKCK